MILSKTHCGERICHWRFCCCRICHIQRVKNASISCSAALVDDSCKYCYTLEKEDIYMNTKFETNILNNSLTVKHIKNEHLHSVNIGIYARKLPEKNLWNCTHDRAHVLSSPLRHTSKGSCILKQTK